MDRRRIVVLGSTGSIGESTLSVVSKFPDRFEIVALVGGDNISKLAEQVRLVRPKLVATKTQKGVEQLKNLLPSDIQFEIAFGTEGAERAAALPEADIVVSAIVGAAGLKPTLSAARAGKTIALANKETLVVAGALVQRVVAQHHATMLPVDSEHSAIFQALSNSPMKQVRRLVLTASGGPFFKKPELDLSTVTKEQALNHPNWKMGEKITIDSATLMNKGLETIEARWLFSVPPSQIDVVVHPQSIIHSMVEFVDGSVIAQLGVPDMKGPIAYALAYPDRLPDVIKFIDFKTLKELHFFEPNHERFPAIMLARTAMEKGATFPAVLNGANEVTVAAFLEKRIRFTDIVRINEKVVSSFRESGTSDLEDYIEADAWGREQAMKLI